MRLAILCSDFMFFSQAAVPCQVQFGLPPDSKPILQMVNQLLEEHGADRFLLCTIGSWRDTLTDEKVLQNITSWLHS